ncbi:uncharacterized protein METZ01_LOCUS474433 [marine metagenome]|uniref:Lipoprotein n=1 Tax=marine metagenome TaxID=408172 RepID=A0A383BNZ0_9ZZZZ
MIKSFKRGLGPVSYFLSGAACAGSFLKTRCSSNGLTEISAHSLEQQ